MKNQTQYDCKGEHIVSIKLNSEMHASVEELRRQWGLSSQSEAVERLVKMVLLTPEEGELNSFPQ
jgi:metal-responsive CopG/Arc/MetJ family transcriptional regulator